LPRAEPTLSAASVAVEHGHDQAQRLGLGEDDRRQPGPTAQPVSAARAAGRIHRNAGLAEDPDIAAGRPLGDAEPLRKLIGGRAGTVLEDLEGT
jgi:hypothetical protein